MPIEPYLFFEGRCDEALAFYQRAPGAKVEMLMRYRDNPAPEANPHGAADKVMHASLRAAEAVAMASDGRCTGQPAFGTVADRFGVVWMVIVPGPVAA